MCAISRIAHISRLGAAQLCVCNAVQNVHQTRKSMSYVQKFKESLQNYTPQDTPHQPYTTNRVIGLSEQLKTWHDTRPIPERWYPVQLGRLAAQFGTSRELTASALGYAGWVEKRSGTISFWQPK